MPFVPPLAPDPLTALILPNRQRLYRHPVPSLVQEFGARPVQPAFQPLDFEESAPVGPAEEASSASFEVEPAE